MNFKRGRAKNQRAGCLLCKPQKANGQKFSVWATRLDLRVAAEDRYDKVTRPTEKVAGTKEST